MRMRFFPLTPAWALAFALAQGPVNADELTLPDDVFASATTDALLDLIILADDYPVVVRYHVEIDGVGFRRAFDDFLGQLHAYLDADQDGVLTPEEVGRGNWSQIFADAPFNTFRASSATIVQSNDDGGGPISVAELRRHVRDAWNVDLVRALGGPPPNPLTERLFDHLDLNGDGRISTDEMAVAHETLAALDWNEDEWIVLDEMNPYATNSRRFLGVPSGGGSMIPDHPFVPLTDRENRHRLADRLLDRYDRDGDGQLDRGERGLPDDARGSLDVAALARWLDDPTPHLELKAVLSAWGSNRSRVPPRLEQLAVSEAIAERIVATSDTSMELDLGPISVELGIGSVFNDYRDFLLRNFEAATTDEKEFLEQADVNQSILRQLFNAADRDGDGKLYEEELIAFLDLFEAATSSRVTLTISDRGRAVFQAMDQDDDLRLSPRELHSLPERLAMLDHDGDGYVMREDFPRRFGFNVGQGPARAVQVAGPTGRPPNGSDKDGVPSWFRKMDRNGDGDVSRREFLGPLDLFDRLDTDGDGLLSPEEAARDVR